MSLKDRFKATHENRLQSDFQKLHAQHEMLNEKLDQLEKKTEAATAWLNTHEHAIITGYHELADALRRHDEKGIRAVADNPALAVILRLPPPEGTDWQEAVKHGITAPTAGNIIPAFNAESSAPAPRAEKEETPADQAQGFGLWSRLTGSAEKELMEKIQQKEREILSLQTRVPYYVESLMDWVEAAVVPEPGGPLYDTPDKKAWNDLMLRHRDPLYTLTQAEKDFLAATDQRIAGMANLAKDYDHLATGLESGKTEQAIQALDQHNGGTHFRKMLGWILDQNDEPSLASFALEKFDKNEDKAAMFDKAVDTENTIVLKGAETPGTVFRGIFKKVQDGKNPLPVSILKKTVDWLGDEAGDIIYDAPNPSFNGTLVATMALNRTQPERMAEILTILMGSGDEARAIAHGFADMARATDAGDNKALESFIHTQGKAGRLGKILDFADIVEGKNLTETIYQTPGANNDAARLLETMADYGIDLWPKQDSRTLIGRAIDMAQDRNFGPFSLPLFEKTIQLATRRTDESMLSLLTETWDIPPLVRVASVREHADDLLSSLLRPLNDNLERNHALRESAAHPTCRPDAAKRLETAADSLSADAVRYDLGGHEIMLMPENIVSVWRENHLRYIHDGERRSLPGTDSSDEARVSRIVVALSNDPRFLRTETELINPAMIEALYADETGLYGLTQGQILSITKDPAMIDSLSGEILEKNPSFISAGGILLNTRQLEYISVTEDGLSITSHGKQYPVPAEAHDIREIFAQLSANPAYTVSGHQALNIEKAGALWPSADNKELAFSINGHVFDSTALQDGAFHTGMAVEDAAGLVKNLKLPASFIRIGPNAVNMDALFSIYTQPEDSSLTWVVDGREHNSPATKSVQEKTFAALRGHVRDLWEDPRRQVAINPALAELITVDQEQKQCIFRCHDQDFPLDNIAPAQMLGHLKKCGALLVHAPALPGGSIAAFWPEKLSRLDLSTGPDTSHIEIFGPGSVERKAISPASADILDVIERQRRHRLLPAPLAKLGDNMAASFEKEPATLPVPAEKLGELRQYAPKGKKPATKPATKTKQSPRF